MQKTINYKMINLLVMLIFIIILYLFLAHVGVIEKMLSLLGTLVPLFLAFFISWMMLPLAKFINVKLKVEQKTANILAIIINILILLTVFFILIPMVIFQMSVLADQTTQITNGVTKTIKEIYTLLNLDGETLKIIKDYYTTQIEFKNYFDVLLESASWIWNLFSNVATVLMQILLGYIISFYLISDIKPFFKKILKFLDKENYDSNIVIAREISKSLFGYIRGLMIVCIVVGTMVTLGCMALDLPSPLLFGVVAGILNIIPFLGPVLGGIPVFIVALSIGLPTALMSLVVVFGTQFIESNFLQPRIMAKSISIHPVSIIVGLLIFSNFFGFVGMIIATPCLAAIGVILKHSKYDLKI